MALDIVAAAKKAERQRRERRDRSQPPVPEAKTASAVILPSELNDEEFEKIEQPREGSKNDSKTKSQVLEASQKSSQSHGYYNFLQNRYAARTGSQAPQEQ